jgi:hypothetical protein
MLGWFIDVNRKHLERRGSQPWFVPEEWGGAGLPETGDLRHRPSQDDIRLIIRMDANNRSSTGVVPKPMTVSTLSSPFHKRVEGELGGRYGYTERRNGSFSAGQYQWWSMKDTPLTQRTAKDAYTESIRADNKIRRYWSNAYKAGGDACIIVRNWMSDQGFDVDQDVGLDGACRQYYEGLLSVGPKVKIPKVVIRSEFADEVPSKQTPNVDGLYGENVDAQSQRCGAEDAVLLRRTLTCVRDDDGKEEFVSAYWTRCHQMDGQIEGSLAGANLRLVA